MKIFIDIGHPAHLHYTRNLIRAMQARGHEFIITARDKECTHELLRHYQIPFYKRGKGSGSILGKLAYLFKADFFLWRKALKYKPDLFLSFSSPYAAHAAALIGKPHLVCDDTEYNRLTQMLYRPFTQAIITPECYEKDLGAKQFRIPAFFEQFYLHPRYFNPDLNIRDLLGLAEDERFCLFRFVSRGASHDLGTSGMAEALKVVAVEQASQHCRVFISSESPLSKTLEKYHLRLAPWLMHHVIAHAELLFGESATMASEAAVLGTPAIYINKHGRGYTREEEKRYGLVFNFNESLEDQNAAIEKAIHILQDKSFKHTCKANHQALLQNTIDPTAFLIDFIEQKRWEKSK